MSWWMHSLGSASGWPWEQENNYESSIMRHFCLENQWLTFNFVGFLFIFFKQIPWKNLLLPCFGQYTSKSKHDTEVVSHQPANQTNIWLFSVRLSLLFVVPEAPRHQRCHSVDVAWIFWIDGWLDTTETLRLSWGDSKLMLFSIWWDSLIDPSIQTEDSLWFQTWHYMLNHRNSTVAGNHPRLSGRFFCRLFPFWKGLVCLEGIFWWIEGCKTHV